jgi:hypothetical protein
MKRSVFLFLVSTVVFCLASCANGGGGSRSLESSGSDVIEVHEEENGSSTNEEDGTVFANDGDGGGSSIIPHVDLKKITTDAKSIHKDTFDNPISVNKGDKLCFIVDDEDPSHTNYVVVVITEGQEGEPKYRIFNQFPQNGIFEVGTFDG